MKMLTTPKRTPTGCTTVLQSSDYGNMLPYRCAKEGSGHSFKRFSHKSILTFFHDSSKYPHVCSSHDILAPF